METEPKSWTGPQQRSPTKGKPAYVLGSTLILWLLFLGLHGVQDRYALKRGLTGAYYDNPQWQGAPVFTVIDKSLDLSTARKRKLSFPQKNYSIRWMGWLYVQKEGERVFKMRADDGSSLTLDGQLIMDTSRVNSSQFVSKKVSLSRGFHSLDLRYFQRLGTGNLEVYGAGPEGGEKRLDVEALFPEKPTPRQLALEQGIRRILRGLWRILPLWNLLAVLYFRKTLWAYLKKVADKRKRMEEGIRALPFPHPLGPFSLAFGLCLVLLGLWMLSSRLASDRGLRVSYYDNPGWEGNSLFSKVVPSLSLRVLDRQGFPQRYYSLQWKGWVYIDRSGDYTLIVKADDGARVWIDGTIILGYERVSSMPELSTTVYLEEGFHPIEIRYYQLNRDYFLSVEWVPPGGRKEPMPTPWFFPEKPADRSFLWKGKVLGILHVLEGLLVLSLGLVLIRPIRAWIRREDPRAPSSTPSTSLRMGFAPSSTFSPVLSGLRASPSHVFMLLVLGGLILFHRLGERSLGERVAGTWSEDEAVHTLVAKRILETGNWFSLEFHGEPYYNKPPLKLWLSAWTFSRFGDQEFYVRVWDALFGGMTLFLTYLLGRSLTGSPFVGLMGALILLSSPYYIFLHNARDGVQDSAANLLFILALFFFWFRTKRASFYYLAGLSMGLGALVKSINGLIPLAIIVPYLGITKTFSEFKNPRFYGMILIAGLLPSAWFIPQSLLTPGFFDEAIKSQLVARASGTLAGRFFGSSRHLLGPFFYLGSLLKGFYPWGFFYPPALLFGLGLALRRKTPIQTRTPILFLLLWVLIVLGGFSVSRYKSDWYIYPLYPALALLMANFAHALMGLSWSFRKKYPLLAVGVPGLLMLLLVHSLYMNYERTYENPKIPIHRWVEYLQEFGEIPYQVVLYNLDPRLLDRQPYYLEKVSSHVLYLKDMETLKALSRSGVPLFVIVTPKAYRAEPFFQEAPYLYKMLNKTGHPLDESDRAKWWVLVYNHHPRSRLFVQNREAQ